MSNVPIVSKKRAGSKKSQSQSAGSPFPVDILPGLFHCDIAPFPFIPDRFELQPRHDTPDFIRTQGVTQARTDLLQDIGRRDEDARLALERFAEMGTDQSSSRLGTSKRLLCMFSFRISSCENQWQKPLFHKA